MGRGSFSFPSGLAHGTGESEVRGQRRGRRWDRGPAAGPLPGTMWPSPASRPAPPPQDPCPSHSGPTGTAGRSPLTSPSPWDTGRAAHGHRARQRGKLRQSHAPSHGKPRRRSRGRSPDSGTGRRAQPASQRWTALSNTRHTSASQERLRERDARVFCVMLLCHGERRKAPHTDAHSHDTNANGFRLRSFRAFALFLQKAGRGRADRCWV